MLSLSGIAGPEVSSDSLRAGGAPDWARQMVALDRDIQRLSSLQGSEAETAADSLLEFVADLSATSVFANDARFADRRDQALAMAESALGGLPEGAEPARFAGARAERLASLDPNGIAPLQLPVVEPQVVFDAFVVPAHLIGLVDQQTARFANNGRFAASMRTRSAQYFPMIEEVLASLDLPTELKYIAVIESALNPRAVSPAGARGLWQIMPGTGRMYGLGVAELNQPTTATRAAARYLAYLGELFDGDWQLALAAYNAGPGRVQGVVRRHARRLGRPPTFWDIYRDLPRETRHYVPRFIAVAQLLAADAAS